MSSRQKVLRRFLLGTFLLLTGRFETAPAAAQPGPPTITPGEPALSVSPGKILTLQAYAKDAESYEWTLQGKGSLGDPKHPVAVYTAPQEGGGTAVLTVVARSAAGASPAASVTVNVRSPAWVALDSLAIPAGWMSSGSPAAYITLSQGGRCRPGSGCTEFSHRLGGGWVGIYWWPPSCGPSGEPVVWERVRTGQCAIDLRRATGIHEFTRLSFWARGQRGGESVEFKIGGHDILPIPGQSLGSRSLTTEWAQYFIDLEGVDLSKAVGLFAWIAKDLENPQGATFSLQDVRFEGFKP